MEDNQNPTQNNQSQSAGQPAQAGGQTGGQAQPPKNDLSGIMEENVDIGSLVSNAGNQQQIQEFVNWAKANMPAHPNTQFNDDEFIKLLAGSISLTPGEKQGIVKNVAKLSQFQVDELMKIFKEEQQKFTELEKKHAEQLAELEKQHSSPELAKEKEEAEVAQQKALDEAEELKRKLMGG